MSDLHQNYQNLNENIYFSVGEKEMNSYLVVNNQIYNCQKDFQLNTLIESAEKATFGRDGESVLDENYRNALTIKTENFETTFDLNEVANCVQSLFKGIDYTRERISIEKYRVNIYQKGGLFHAHKDTPRGSEYLGTLVVCLPSEFEGGDFCMQNKLGKIAKINWSTLSKSHHQWICFYGDTTHWIEEIKEGTRITMTYNIYKRKIENNVKSYSEFEKAFTEFVNNLKFENFKQNITHDDDFEDYLIENKDTEKDNYYFALPTHHLYIKEIVKKRKENKKDKYKKSYHEVFNLKQSDLKGADKIMFQILFDKGLEPEIGYCLSDGYSNYITKYFIEAPHSLYDIDIGGYLREEYTYDALYPNVCLLNKGNFELELMDKVASYGNEPRIDSVYESVLIMIKVKMKEIDNNLIILDHKYCKTYSEDKKECEECGKLSHYNYQFECMICHKINLKNHCSRGCLKNAIEYNDDYVDCSKCHVKFCVCDCTLMKDCDCEFCKNDYDMNLCLDCENKKVKK